MIYFYVSLSTYICYIILKYKNLFSQLQKNKYNTKKYKEKIAKNSKEYINPELFSLILIITALSCDIKTEGILMIITYTILFLYKQKKEKLTLKKDKKLISRIVIISIAYIIINVIFYLDYQKNHTGLIFETTQYYYIVLIICSISAPLIVHLSNILSKPIDKKIK